MTSLSWGKGLGESAGLRIAEPRNPRKRGKERHYWFPSASLGVPRLRDSSSGRVLTSDLGPGWRHWLLVPPLSI